MDDDREEITLKPMEVGSGDRSDPSSNASIQLTWKNISLFSILCIFLAAFSYWSGATHPLYEGATTAAPSFRNGGTIGKGDEGTGPITPPVTEATKSPTAAPKVKFDFSEGIKAVNEQRKMLEDYYAPHHRMNSTWAHDAGSENWVKSQTFLANQIARALVNKRKFVTGAIGSSVMAGHDNCNYDSFPSQMERFMKPLFVAAGSDYEFRNGGEGGSCGDDMRNQIFCMKANAGQDLDALVYSWSYFESHNEEETHESIVRWSLMNKHQHPVHFFYTSNGKNTAITDCMTGPTKKKDQELVKLYAEYGMNAFCLDGALKVVPTYKDPGWGNTGDGLHQTTRYGKTDEGGDREKSLGVIWRNWHPGPLSFQLVADSFSYMYMEAMLMAFDMINKDPDPAKKWDDYEWPVLSQYDLPKPLFCDNPDAIFPCMIEDPPQCTTYELPSFGYNGMKKVGLEDDLNPFAQATIAKSPEDAWHLKMERRENKVPKQEQKYGDKCKSLDSCGFQTAGLTPDAGTLAYKIPKVGKGGLILCCSSKKCAQTEFTKENIKVMLGEEEIDPAGWEVDYPMHKCIRLQKHFPPGMSDPSGHPYIGITMREGATSAVHISQLIAY